jgi:DNA-binding MarR family transcriptional regulator
MLVDSFRAIGLDDERRRLAEELFELNSQVHDQAMGLVGPMPMPPDLTMQQMRVLDHIVKQPGITGHELGELLMVSAPTASGLIERLVEKGLISRSDDADDRRVRRLHPTEAGMEVMRQMNSMFGRALGVVLQLLSADDLELLCRGASAMLAALGRAHEIQDAAGRA